jgi:hypothetical protein
MLNEPTDPFSVLPLTIHFNQLKRHSNPYYYCDLHSLFYNELTIFQIDLNTDQLRNLFDNYINNFGDRYALHGYQSSTYFFPFIQEAVIARTHPLADGEGRGVQRTYAYIIGRFKIVGLYIVMRRSPNNHYSFSIGFKLRYIVEGEIITDFGHGSARGDNNWFPDVQRYGDVIQGQLNYARRADYHSRPNRFYYDRRLNVSRQSMYKRGITQQQLLTIQNLASVVNQQIHILMFPTLFDEYHLNQLFHGQDRFNLYRQPTSYLDHNPILAIHSLDRHQRRPYSFTNLLNHDLRYFVNRHLEDINLP